MFCTKCGASLPPQAQFCSSCGTAASQAAAPRPVAAASTAPLARKQDFWGWSWRDAGLRLMVLGGFCAAGNAYAFHLGNPYKSIGYAAVVGIFSALLYFAIIGGLVATVRKIMPSTRALPVARSFGIAIGVTFIINAITTGCALRMMQH